MTDVKVVSEEHVFFLSNASSFFNLFILIVLISWPHVFGFFRVLYFDFNPVWRGVIIIEWSSARLVFFYCYFLLNNLICFRLFLTLRLLNQSVYGFALFTAFAGLWGLRLVVFFNVHRETEITAYHGLRANLQSSASCHTNLLANVETESIPARIELLTAFIFWFEVRMKELLLIFLSDTNSLIMHAAFKYHTIFLLS